jgi:hypothetical protein
MLGADAEREYCCPAPVRASILLYIWDWAPPRARLSTGYTEATNLDLPSVSKIPPQHSRHEPWHSFCLSPRNYWNLCGAGFSSSFIGDFISRKPLCVPNAVFIYHSLACTQVWGKLLLVQDQRWQKSTIFSNSFFFPFENYSLPKPPQPKSDIV